MGRGGVRLGFARSGQWARGRLFPAFAAPGGHFGQTATMRTQEATIAVSPKAFDGGAVPTEKAIKGTKSTSSGEKHFENKSEQV